MKRVKHAGLFLPCNLNETYGVFAGAGISLNSGIPLVSALIKKIVDSLPLKKADSKLFFSRKFPFEAFLQKIRSEVEISEILKIFTLGKPNQSHTLIAKIAKTGKLKVIITTNFDTLIEQALVKEGVNFKAIFRIEELEKFKIRRGKLFLLKIHGSIDDIEKIGAILERITAKTNISSVQNTIRNFFHSGDYENIIFTGYSRSDFFDIIPEIEKASKTTKKIFFINHIKEDSTAINLINTIYPFERFKRGNVISINTDLLVKKLWGKFSSTIPVPNKPNSEIWETLIEKWATNSSLNKNGINGLILCGKLMTFIGYYKRAIKYYNRALRLAMDKSLNNKITKIFLYTAQVYSHLGMYAEAKEAFEESLIYCKKSKDWNNYAKILSDLGSTNRKEGNYKLAIDLQNKALRIFSRLENYQEIRNCLIIKGNAYLNSENFPFALKIYQEALETPNKIPNLQNDVILLNSLAAVCIELNNLFLAKKYLTKAEKIADKLEVPRIICALEYNWGSFYIKKGNYEQAIKKFSSAFKIAITTHDFYQSFIILKKRSEIYEKLRLYKKALTDISFCITILKQKPSLKKQDFNQLRKREKRLLILLE